MFSNEEKPPFVNGHAIVQLVNNKYVDDLQAEISKKYQLNLTLEPLSIDGNIWLIKFDDTNVSTQKFLEIIKKLEYVNIAQLNHSNISKRNVVPNDKFFYNQWAHVNSGTGGVVDADMDSDEAWQFTTGGYTAKRDRIVVAVVDEGVDLTHDDLTIWTNKHEIPGNSIDDDNNGYVDDVHGYDFWDNDGDPSNQNSWEDHATHVSGIIGAKGNNCLGVVGVNWDVDIMVIRGSSSVESEVIKAYDYVWKMRKLYNKTYGDSGAYVVSTNSSFGVDRANPNDYPLWCAFYDSLGTAGIISAVAGPNLNINIDNEGDVPGACPSDYTICVTNTNKSDDRAFAGYGVINVDIGAPGSSIYSTLPGNSYGNMTGTSMATPQVAGAVALMHSAMCESLLSEYTPDEMALFLKDKMLTQGIDSVNNLSGEVSSYGRLNLLKCVTAVSASANENITHPTCNLSDGQIDLEVLGTNEPYTITWSTGMKTLQLTGLTKGTYNYTITDSQGCSNTKSISLDDSPVVEKNLTPSKCKGFNNGSIELSSIGSDTPYSYTWNNNATSNLLTGLASGDYFVTVTSSSGCKTESSLSLKDSLNNSVLTVFSQQDTCGDNAGMISVELDQTNNFFYGTCLNNIELVKVQSPYTYTWSNGMTTDTIKGLSKGNYSISLTTNEGCIFDTTIVINSMIKDGTLIIDYSKTDLNCYNDNSGNLSINSINGGSSPFTYQWSNGNNTSSISGLSAGTYDLTITDINDCVQYNEYTIAEPTALNVYMDIQQMSGHETNDGTIAAVITGGTYPYTYSWSTSSGASSISGLSVGSYSITVTDFNNCVATTNGNIDYISGIEEYVGGIIVYPNPTSGHLLIQTNNRVNRVSVYNFIGQKVFEEYNTKLVDLRNQSNGIYFLNVELDNGSLEQIKVIKQ